MWQNKLSDIIFMVIVMNLYHKILNNNEYLNKTFIFLINDKEVKYNDLIL